VVGYQRL